MIIFLKNRKILEIIGYIIVLGSIFLVHSINLFQYPYYENDEGTYISQAWAIIKLNSLAPYTYWYDHAPFGWILIAFLSKILGGFYTFGTAINTGRVMMLILHMFSSFYIIKIVKKTSHSILAGFIAALFFSVLPLSNYFQRRVLLDNILVFWFLPAYYLLLEPKLKIRNVIFSAILFSTAILSKETGIFFIPAILFLIYTGLGRHQKAFGFVTWIGFFSGVIALYPLLAILKTELLPSSDKVSLLQTLLFQASRGDNKLFFIQGSDFMRTYSAWISRDPASVYIIIGAIIVSFLFFLFNIKKRIWTSSILLLCGYLYFLLRGKIVLEFYIIPLFPITSILVGLMVERIFSFVKQCGYVFKFIVSIAMITSLFYIQLVVNPDALYKNETRPYEKATSWIKNNISTEKKLVIDNGIWMELHDSQSGKEKVFKNADYYWKSDLDPDIKVKKLYENPEEIDYIFATFQYYTDMESGSLPFNQKALNESKQIVDFSEGGITATIFQTIKNKKQILKNTWETYKKQFLVDSDHVVDPQAKNTTSESQSYALLRALWSDDLTTFDKVWRWTKSNLQIRKDDKLLAWKKTLDGKVDLENATDGDIDTALALVLASRKLEGLDMPLSESYKLEGLSIIQDIWKHRVITIGTKKALLPFSSMKDKGYEFLNPSYFSPAHYRIFAEIDSSSEWNNLAFDSYQILKEIGKNRVLVPNWTKFNYATGEFEDATQTMGNPSANEFGFDALRAYFRASLDAKWFNRQEAKDFLGTGVGFLESEYKNFGIIKSSYNAKGEVIENFESAAMDAAVHSILEGGGSKLAGKFWREKFIERVDINNQLFDQNNNYYNQNWGWFEFANKENLLKIKF
jgi:endo-1,4-beta-D-glucanase Y